MRALELVSLTLVNYVSAILLLLWPQVIIASSHSESNEDVSSAAGRIVYDQRQNGKYNIHVSIKDVAIIEVDQNELADETFDDTDYYYDDSDLTVKPIKFTTSAPLISLYDFSTTASTLNVAAATTPAAAAPSVDLTYDDNEDTVLSTTIPNRFVASTTNGLTPNITYSPNLLADIAATQAAQETQTLQTIVANSSTTSTTKRPRHKTQNVVIVTNSTEHSMALTSKKGLPSPPASSSSSSLPLVPMPALFNDLRARTKDIPILQSSVNEPSKQQQEQHQQQHHQQQASSLNENSRIFKVKVQRAAGQQQKQTNAGATQLLQPMTSRRCRANQYRDASGNCRSKRSSASASSSFLRKLFSMLVSLPFASERSVHHPYQYQHQHHQHHLQQHNNKQEEQQAAIHDSY